MVPKLQKWWNVEEKFPWPNRDSNHGTLKWKSDALSSSPSEPHWNQLFLKLKKSINYNTSNLGLKSPGASFENTNNTSGNPLPSQSNIPIAFLKYQPNFEPFPPSQRPVPINSFGGSGPSIIIYRLAYELSYTDPRR